MQLTHLKKEREMRKRSIGRISAFLAVVGIAGLDLAGCSGSSQKTNQAAQKDAQTVHYTCSMHPEVLQNKPGDCPKCGMKLVEKR
jgi:hypothetical protein